MSPPHPAQPMVFSRQRGPVGKLVLAAFVLFNVAMVLLALFPPPAAPLRSSGYGGFTDMMLQQRQAGEQTLGTILLWLTGFVVLGVLTLLTRGPLVGTPRD